MRFIDQNDYFRLYAKIGGKPLEDVTTKDYAKAVDFFRTSVADSGCKLAEVWQCSPSEAEPERADRGTAIKLWSFEL